MPRPVIDIDGIGKRYRVGADRQKYLSLRDEMVGWLSPAARRARASRAEFWALRDVSFAVSECEAVAIIGRNGAGKTTLLKLLSRITPPTEGRITLRGRVASLLEVGTGFHPELTGRENIYLNSSILGMTRRETARRFDEIVEFSGIERFLDTPVKRYSSGMYVRLAFAVAAHLEPEILLVDEVLAVGDAEFQQKCLGKMRDVGKSGRTVLFVSHNMQAVSSLCSRAVMLSQGRVVLSSDVRTVVSRYMAAGGTTGASIEWNDASKRPGDESLRLTAVRVRHSDDSIGGVFASGEPIIVEMAFELATRHPALTVGFDLVASDGALALRSYHNDGDEAVWPDLRVGRNTLRCVIPPGLLNAGCYRISPRVGLHCLKWIVDIESVVEFHVELSHGRSPFWNVLSAGKRPGVVAPILDWSSRNGQAEEGGYVARH